MVFLQEELRSCGKQSSVSSKVFIIRKRRFQLSAWSSLFCTWFIFFAHIAPPSFPLVAVFFQYVYNYVKSCIVSLYIEVFKLFPVKFMYLIDCMHYLQSANPVLRPQNPEVFDPLLSAVPLLELRRCYFVIYLPFHWCTSSASTFPA